MMSKSCCFLIALALTIADLATAQLAETSFQFTDADLAKPSLGITAVPVGDLKERLREENLPLPRREGIIVINIMPNSPAKQAGLRPLDMILTIDKTPVRSVDDLLSTVSALESGKEYELFMYRCVPIKNNHKWRSAKIKTSPVSKRDLYLSAMREQVDDVRGLKFYEHSESPKSVSSRNELLLYFSVRDGHPHSLRMKIQYVAEDWLFVRKYTVKAGDKTYPIMPKRQEVERDNGSGKVWEWYDFELSTNQRDMLFNIMSSDEVTLRYEGDQHYSDRTITTDEKERLVQVYAAYKVLGGE